jgi:cephalosporin-C deacetylase-like acetyl esterase
MAAVPATTIKVSARAERASAVYHRAEKVTFVIKVTDKDKPVAKGSLSWTLLKDGLPLNQAGQAPLKAGQALVTGQLDEPGFLQLRVSFQSNPKAPAVAALAGAAIDPADIRPSLPVPDDFDAFWTEQKQKLAKVPAAPRLTPVTSSKTVDAFDVQADSVGAPVSGYLARPKGAMPKSLPAILTVHGAGVQSSSLGGAESWAGRGFIAMDMNAHGLPNGKPKEFYKEQNDGPLKDYRIAGRESRETNYFLGMFLRLVRGIDVLTAQPEWDGKTVVVFGSSQGGYQAIVAAGLDPRVTFFGAGVPAGCDHTASAVGRIAGWPKMVPNGPDGKPDAKVLNEVRYFDAVNFASRTKAAGCFFTVGFIDTTCPPSSVYAAYNQVAIPKGIYNDILSGHANSPQAMSGMVNAVTNYVAKLK